MTTWFSVVYTTKFQWKIAINNEEIEMKESHHHKRNTNSSRSKTISSVYYLFLFPSMFISAKYFLCLGIFFFFTQSTERKSRKKNGQRKWRRRAKYFHRHKQSGVLKLIPSNIFIDLVEEIQPSVWENCSSQSCVRLFFDSL